MNNIPTHPASTLASPKHASFLLGVVIALAMILAVPPARADFTHARLLSGTPEMQFEQAHAPAVSRSGEYVAFQGTLAGVLGVYRRDLRSGEVQLVAGGDAAAPSISAEGRYIAFTTTADLDPSSAAGQSGEPAGDRGCPEVYIRDMDPGPGEPEYELASTLNQSQTGITYEGHLECQPKEGLPVAGAQAASAVALSANGRKVAFTLLDESNLAGPGTPPGQVAVRDLESETTTLVTTTPEGKPVPGGGAFPDDYSLSHVSGDTITQSPFDDQPAGSSAAISADGNTVAWVGMNVAAQVSPAEAAREPSLVGLQAGEEQESEAEPLWRRIADPEPITRRLLVGAGLTFFTPFDPAESHNNPVNSGAFIGTAQTAFIPPALSENGQTVALIATAPPSVALPSLNERITGLSNFFSDAYVVRMSDDPSVVPQVTPLTQITSYATKQYALASVRGVAISPDGTRVVFATERTPLESPSLALISPPSAPYASEVYEANLELGTLQRVTSAYDEAEVNGSMELSSIAGDDQTLVFASQATNLFFGDGVDAGEVYEASEIPESASAVSPQPGEAPALTLPNPSWLLSATAVPQPDGSVLVYAQVPGAGHLTVQADAQLPNQTTTHTKKKQAKHPHATRSKTAAVRLTTHTVAHNALAATTPGEVQARVRVSLAYRSLVNSTDGLYTILRVTFAAPGHATLVQDIPVTLYARKTRKQTAHGSKKGSKRKTAAKSKSRKTGAKA